MIGMSTTILQLLCCALLPLFFHHITKDYSKAIHIRLAITVHLDDYIPRFALVSKKNIEKSKNPDGHFHYFCQCVLNYKKTAKNLLHHVFMVYWIGYVSFKWESRVQFPDGEMFFLLLQFCLCKLYHPFLICEEIANFSPLCQVLFVPKALCERGKEVAGSHHDKRATWCCKNLLSHHPVDSRRRLVSQKLLQNNPTLFLWACTLG